MLATTLVDLDPDKLLSTYSVEQAEGVARRLQKEVDTKREELRVMVGERYRDLIEAADTIQKMKTSSHSVIDSLGNIHSSCYSLQQKTAAYSKPFSTTDVGPSRVNLPYLSVAASIKLLMSLPESIWAAVETGKLAQGSELFLLAQHVNTGLQGDQGGGVSGERVEQWFPVLTRQIATINNFHQNIIASAKDQLMTVELSEEEGIDSVAALLLLNQGSNTLEIFRQFLSIRRDCLVRCARTGRSDPAKTAMANFLRVVVSTVACVHTVFGGGGGLAGRIEAVAGAQAEPTIALLGGSSIGPTGKYLPEPVKKFQPKLTFLPVPQNTIAELTVDWLEKAQELGVEEAGTLLEHVVSIQGVAGIRQEVHSLLSGEKEQNWPNIVQATTGNSLNLWESFYRDCVRERVEHLVAGRLEQHTRQLEQQYHTHRQTCQDEINLGSYVWSESSGDLNNVWKKQGIAVGGSRSNIGGLGLKCRGWSLVIQELASNWETSILGLWNDLVGYNSGEEGEQGEVEPFDKYSDSEQIFQHFSTVLRTKLSDLVEELAEVKSNEVVVGEAGVVTAAGTGVAAGGEAGLVFLARFLQAFPQLNSPTLKLCLSKEEEGSSGIERIFSRKSAEIFAIWSGHLIQEFGAQLEDCGGSINTSVLDFLPAWDKANVQESGDDGAEVTSVISIPCTPSGNLINPLHWLAVKVHQCNPATVPSSVLLATTEQMLRPVLQASHNMLQAKMTQNTALQLTFNIKFMQTLFLSREFKERLAPEFERLIDLAEANIDPFDLSVFTSHLETRVKRACARELSALGCLVPVDRVQLVTSYKTSTTSSSSSQDTPNIMSLAKNPPPRFQLLPISSGRESSSDLHHSASATSSSSSAHRLLRPTNLGGGSTLDPKKSAAAAAAAGGKGRRDRSPVASAAASFFGSMSSSWFGGGGAGN